MATGADHYAEAERLANMALEDRDMSVESALLCAAVGQISATLALAAAVEKQTQLAHGVDSGGYGR
jgi:hypothetical protein